MKTRLSLHIYAVLFILLCVINPSCTPTIEDRAKTYEKAHNSHDIEKVMSLYADDITFEIIGSWKKAGKKQVQEIAEWDAATNSHMIISNIKVNEDTVKFKLKEGNDWFRLTGIEYMYYEPCRMVFHDGLIKELTAEVTKESMREFHGVWPSIYQWLSEQRSDELSKLISDGKFVYNSDNAKKWLSLLEDWKKAND